jgi:hypothetical protein
MKLLNKIINWVDPLHRKETGNTKNTFRFRIRIKLYCIGKIILHKRFIVYVMEQDGKKRNIDSTNWYMLANNQFDIITKTVMNFSNLIYTNEVTSEKQNSIVKEAIQLLK